MFQELNELNAKAKECIRLSERMDSIFGDNDKKSHLELSIMAAMLSKKNIERRKREKALSEISEILDGDYCDVFALKEEVQKLIEKHK